MEKNEKKDEVVDENEKKGGDVIYSLWANIKSNGPILLSVVGFIISIIILFPKSCSNKNVYHDLELKNKQELVAEILVDRISLLNGKLSSLQKKLDTAKNAARTSIEDSIRKVNAAIGTAKRDSFNLVSNNVDTSLSFFSKYMSCDRNSYKEAIGSLQQNDSINVSVGLFDSSSIISSTPILKSGNLTIKKNKINLVTLFNKYPNFGFWFFFSIAQMTLWFLIAALVIGVVKRTDKRVDATLPYSFKNALYFSIIPTITIGVFVWLLYWKLIETYVIEDSYFLDSFNLKMLFYSIPGYLVAILCFGAYLFLSNKLEMLNYDAQQKGKDLSMDTELQDKFKELKSAFDTTFLFSAIILSVFVLWTGLMFNAVNGLEAMRFYNQLSRSPFISYDFVYLVGLMHSLLLLIFYVPVRLRFNSLDIKKADDAIRENQGVNKYFKAFWESIGTVLITASPLITTILQKFISNLIGS